MVIDNFIINFLSLVPVIIFFLLLEDNLPGMWSLLYYAAVVLACIFPIPALAIGLFYVTYFTLTKSRCYLCPNNEAIQTLCEGEIKNTSYIKNILFFFNYLKLLLRGPSDLGFESLWYFKFHHRVLMYVDCRYLLIHSEDQ